MGFTKKVVDNSALVERFFGPDDDGVEAAQVASFSAQGIPESLKELHCRLRLLERMFGTGGK